VGRSVVKIGKRKHSRVGRGSVASSAGIIVIDCAPHVKDRSRKVIRSLVNPIVPMPVLLIEAVEECQC